MDILLSQIWPVPNPNQYKLHLACWNQHDQFSREFIFALIDFYPQKDRWLFGGAYRIISRRPVNGANSYDIERVPEYEPFVGRLKIALSDQAERKPSTSRTITLD